MTRVLVLFLAGLIAAPVFSANLTVVKPEQAGMSTERLKRLSTALRGFIDQGELAGTVMLISRRGRVVHFEAQGLMDVDAKAPMTTDAIFRLASMTKPLTSVAIMMLLEEGRLLLNDPVSKFIPEFKNPKVAVPGAAGSLRPETRLVPAEREIDIRDLLTHSAGLALAMERGPEKETIGEYNRRLAKLPLRFHPGAAFEYGPATDVLASVVESISGQRFDQFLSERILKPLEMNDTFYYVPDGKLNRLATAYEAAQPKGIRRIQPARDMRGSQVRFGGASGLLSTAEDYLKFCNMLLNRGSYGGARMLSRKTIDLMTANHIGDHPMEGPHLAGYRFGLGFRVLTDPGQMPGLSTPGEYGWAGAMGTYFWIDPKEEMIGILMTQKSPTPRMIRLHAQALAVQAIVD
jgi:CubicO group peptidase (beta-lactamase class C family)